MDYASPPFPIPLHHCEGLLHWGKNRMEISKDFAVCSPSDARMQLTSPHGSPSTSNKLVDQALLYVALLPIVHKGRMIADRLVEDA